MYVISCACPITAKQRNDRFSPTALEEMPSAAFAEASCRFVIFRSRPINRRSGQRSCPAPKSKIGGGGRNARATSSRLRTFSGFPTGNSPSRITGCRWLCRNHSASSGNFTFRWIHSQPETLHLATQKLRHLVKKLWRMTLPCGRMRKTEKYSSSLSSFPCDRNHFHLVKPSLAYPP